MTTTVDADNILIQWTAPADGGSPIFEYVVLIRQNEGLYFSRDTASCNGYTVEALQQHKCYVPISTLRGSPWLLEWGSHVFAKVQAKTLVGDSPWSAVGNGAEIVSVPDAPQSFMNNVGLSHKTLIAVTWYEGPEPGGRPVLDYRLWYMYETTPGIFTDWVVLADSLTDTFYSLATVEGLWYKFRVQARNENGFGAFTDTLEIRSAQVPSMPENVVTAF